MFRAVTPDVPRGFGAAGHRAAAGPDPARPGQRALARLPPRAARDHRGGPGHLLDLAGADVPGRRAAVAGQLPGAGPGRLRGDGPGRGDLRRGVPLPAPRPGRVAVPRPQRDGPRPHPGRGRGGPADHPAGHLLPDRRAGPGRDAHAAVAGAAAVQRRGRGPVGGPAGRARAGRARDARAARPGRGGHPLGARGAARPDAPGRRVVAPPRGAAARAPVRAARGERGLPGRLRRHPGAGARRRRGAGAAQHDGARHPPHPPRHRAAGRQPHAASACARPRRPSWPTASARRGRWPRRAARSRWAATATR